MYRVIGGDGVAYVAPDLATLQVWVDEKRIAPSMQIEDMSQGRTVPAASIAGLRWPPIAPQTVMQTPYAGYPRGVTPYAQSVRVPWVLAILSTLLCCLPLGVVSIVYCAQANSHVTRGDMLAAQSAVQAAQKWGNASVVLGFLGLLCNFLVGGWGLFF